MAAQGRLVVTAADGTVVALDTADGRRVWDRRKQSDGGRAKVALSGRVLCVTGKNLTAVDVVDLAEGNWITADANRVFLLDGTTLAALPVF
ncbi:PQQ-binding-like beta-propeller repeat protein [Streptomyces virginiae]|uniref:outer membrane protein assembly factor BamB family protein n=1 Tax=Streptomyces virginiae TaxID=1961 RepID=UPI0037FA1A55